MIREKAGEIGQIAKARISHIDIEAVRKIDYLVILKEKGKCRAPKKLLVRAPAYYTMRTQTVLPLNQIIIFKKKIKIRSMVRINNNPVEVDGCRLNPYPYFGIYMISVKEAQ